MSDWGDWDYHVKGAREVIEAGYDCEHVSAKAIVAADERIAALEFSLAECRTLAEKRERQRKRLREALEKLGNKSIEQRWSVDDMRILQAALAEDANED